MKFNEGQKEVISNIFRDLTKLTIVALVLGQFVPGQHFSWMIFIGGLVAAILMATTAVLFASNNKEDEE